ncbi:thiol-disulfide oxidoreductase DCC family protein [Roseivivax sediminis]|uniref:DUF393 domain-containing protein n=1 Tax=Roseivivax sediminis TaxID=936889 RepID=A0A1I2B7V9_9RHOB|nr:DUF393 domain-containing protein [Roseivivax sediminis]SFE51998.1 Protein of unknown function, DUF393 [Roseivivax sediminis]
MTVLYNDTCPICAREVAAYRRMTRSDPSIAYRGLSEGEMERFGLSRRQAARRFHVLKDGELHDGIPAFALVWARIPKLAWLARAVRLPVIGALARGLYDHVAAPALFALHRRRVRLGKAIPRG